MTGSSSDLTRRRLLGSAAAAGAALAALVHRGAGAGGADPDRLSGAAQRPLQHRGQRPGALRPARGRFLQRRRRAERPQGRARGARRQARSRRGGDTLAGADRVGEGEFPVRLAVGLRAALGQPGRQQARRDLQLDQPVRHHQRGVRLHQVHLPRGAQSAHDLGRGRALRLRQARRQEGRLSDRRLRLRPRDAARLPARRPRR